MMWKKYLLFALLFPCFALANTSLWNYATIYQQNISNKNTYRLITFTNTKLNKTISFNVASFTQKHYRALLVDQPNVLDYFSGLSVSSNTKKHHAVLGVNGGYFTPNYAPLGLYIINHHILSSFNRSELLSGIVMINNHGQLFIRERNAYYKNAKYAFQAGPFLLRSNGRYIKKSKPFTDRRTLLATTKNNHILVISTTPATLAGVSYILKHYAKAFSEVGLKNAINLDGGTSTAMTLFFPNETPLVIPERLPVRTVLMFRLNEKSALN